MNYQYLSVRLITESGNDIMFVITNDTHVFEIKTIIGIATPLIPIETFSEKTEVGEAFRQIAWNSFKLRQDNISDTHHLNFRLNEIFDDVYSRLENPESHILYEWDKNSWNLPLTGSERSIEYDLSDLVD